MAGFFTPEDVDRFLEAQRAAHARLTCGPNEHLTLNDLREMKIQPQDTVAAFRNLLADPKARSRRLAFVVSGTLAKAQLMRALEGRPVACFTDELEAEQWLFAGEGATDYAA